MKCKLYKTDNPDLFRLIDEETNKPAEIAIKIGSKKSVLKVKEYITKADLQDLINFYKLEIDTSEL